MNRLHRRLLGQHLLITAMILLAVEATLYTLVRRSAHLRLETTLRKQIEKINSLTELEPDFPEVYDKRVDELPLDDHAISWQVLTEAGQVLGHSRDLAGGRLLPAVGGASPRDRLHIAEEEVLYLGRVLVGRVRVLKPRLETHGRPVTMPPTMIFDIRAAIRTEGVEHDSRRLLLYLGLGFPIVLAVAGLGANSLIERALRPVTLALQRERRFAGSASHQLRTPLTALRGEIDVALRRERSGPEYAEALRRLQPTVAHMTKVIESLLTLARAEAGNLLIGSDDLGTHELATAVREAISMLDGRQRVQVNDQLPREARMAGDRVQLTQAVRNLVENALDHGGGGTVTLSLRLLQGELEIEVADEGPGFPPSVLASPRARATDSDAPARFGLALARAVVAAHAGTLDTRNRATGGAVATIRLPLMR